MKTLIPIFFIILGIFYVITPYNLLPSFIPVIGWIDDIAVTALIIYYLKFGKLPDFINRFLGRLTGGARHQSSSRNHHYQHHQPGSGSTRGTDQDPYEVLGISRGASSQEIHAAYRRMVQQYHPDKVSHLGREIQETAQRKFVEIQRAYEQLNGKNH
jgi:hypothetical protein